MHSTIVTYDTDLISENERAMLITDSKNVTIESIDGKRIRTLRQFWDNKWDADVYLQPGEHEIEIKIWNGPTFDKHIYSFYLFKFNAIAGQNYRVKHKLHERSAKAYIEDVKTGQTVSKVISSQNEPADNPAEVYENSVYFSMLPPQDSGWIIVFRNPSKIVFGKEGSHLDETYVVSVMVTELPKLNSKEDFMEFIRDLKDKNADKNRFHVINNSVEYFSGREDYCAKLHLIAEDKDAVRTSNNKEPMILEMVDYFCRHPQNKNIGISFDYSSRYYKGNQDSSLVEKAKNVFESLKF
jgi:hypothetical protein